MMLLLVACVGSGAGKGDEGGEETGGGDTGTVPTDDTGGTTTGDCGGAALVEGVVYATVQEAVDAAADGGTVQVCAGTWPANVVIDHDLSIVGQGDTISVLDGAHAAACSS